MIIIHTCNKRLWYVNDFLIPQLKEQGILDEDIKVWLDRNGQGNLKSCMDSFVWCGSLESKDSWHLQDDVLISSDFVQRIKELNYYTGVINGFICEISGNFEYVGGVKQDKTWYSFPCIRIPNKIAQECGHWFFSEAIADSKYRSWVLAGKYDDSIFKAFMELKYPNMDYLNLKPNLVEHVDYMLGGSQVNPYRTPKTALSYYWNEPKRTLQLKESIDKYRKEHNI